MKIEVHSLKYEIKQMNEANAVRDDHVMWI